MSRAEISVIVLAYGDEPLLGQCVSAILASRDEEGLPLVLELVLVDNGGTGQQRDLPEHERMTVLRMDANLGFAGGCNVGAEACDSDVLVFVNSDAIVDPTAVARLAKASREASTGLVCGSVRLLDTPERINTVGNPVHFLGFAWAGGYGEPASTHLEPGVVTAITGAFFAVRRDVWEDLGGFDDSYFAYHEDVELSLRAWQRGYRVRYEATATAVHDYSFSKNPSKHYLVERNRLLTVLTTYPGPLLVRLVPALLLIEIITCLTAAFQGWLPQKLRGYGWLIRHRDHLRARRASVGNQASLPVSEFAALLSRRIEPANVGHPPGLGVLNALLSAYYSLATRSLPRHMS